MGEERDDAGVGVVVEGLLCFEDGFVTWIVGFVTGDKRVVVVVEDILIEAAAS